MPHKKKQSETKVKWLVCAAEATVELSPKARLILRSAVESSPFPSRNHEEANVEFLEMQQPFRHHAAHLVLPSSGESAQETRSDAIAERTLRLFDAARRVMIEFLSEPQEFCRGIAEEQILPALQEGAKPFLEALVSLGELAKFVLVLDYALQYRSNDELIDALRQAQPELTEVEIPL